jgi:hypothetical protein
VLDVLLLLPIAWGLCKGIGLECWSDVGSSWAYP